MNEDYLLNIIRNIEDSHKAQHIAPSYASKNEIMERIYDDMRSALGSLLKRGKIEYHRTLNSWAVDQKHAWNFCLHADILRTSAFILL